MLVVAGFPAFVVFFFGIFAYFLWKIFTSGSRSETRDIFEFYLAANEMLRHDERKWFGFEIRDVISRGVRIVQSMAPAPPLVHFALGALYNKIGDHKEAVTNLKDALETDQSDEMKLVFPSAELRNYVKVLRKIEREPAEAPMTSAAVRSLERARRLRGRTLLDESRKRLEETAPPATLLEAERIPDNSHHEYRPVSAVESHFDGSSRSVIDNGSTGRRKKKAKDGEERFGNRKPITEVLHDIYDETTH